MLEAGVVLEGMAPKALAKEFKAVAKAMKSKEDAVKLSALERVAGDVRYLTEGGCLAPLLEAVAPKKKSLEFSKTAIDGLLRFLETKPAEPPQSLPAVLALKALLESEGHLDALQVLSNLLVYKDEIKKVKEVKIKVKKGEPIPEPEPPAIEPDSALSVELRSSSLKAVYSFAAALDFLPAYLPDEVVLALKRAFAKIPDLASNLCAVVLGVRGNPGGFDSPSLVDRLSAGGEDVALVTQEGVHALASLALVARHGPPSQVLQVVMSSGVLDALPSLTSANESLSLHCTLLLDVLSLDAQGLQFVISPPTLGLLLVTAEAAAAAASSSRSRTAELATVVKTFTLIAEQADGSVFEVDDTVTRLVAAVTAAMMNPAVWTLCQAPDGYPYNVPLWELVNACCILLGSLGKVGTKVREASYAAGGVTALLSVLQQSVAICGTPVAPLAAAGPVPFPDLDTEKIRRVNNLRRVAEQAVLFLLTEQSDNASPLQRWVTCAQFSTDDALFGPEAAVPFPSGAVLALVGAEGDDDLNNRGARIIAALLQSSQDPAALMGRLDLGAAGASKLSAVVQARVGTALELLAVQPAGEVPIENGEAPAADIVTEPPLPLPASATVDVLVCQPVEALYHALCALEPLLLQSSEMVNVFASQERIAALAALLAAAGPTALSGAGAGGTQEAIARLSDPRLLSWVPTQLSAEGDAAKATLLELRPLILDILAVVAGADAKYRTFDGEVPPAADAPLPSSTSPSSEQALSVCNLCSNVVSATIMRSAQFVLSPQGIVLSTPAATFDLSVLVLDSALRLQHAMGSCGQAGTLVSLQALADAGFADSAEQQEDVVAAMRLLRAFLAQYPVATPATSEGEAEASVPGSLPPGFAYAAPTSFADTVDFFDASTIPTSAKLLQTPSLWPIVTLCAPLVGVVANPRHSSTTVAHAVEALDSLCRSPLLLDVAQPVVLDAVSAVVLSLGGGVALLGACGAFGTLAAAHAKESGQALAAFLLSRGANRESFWSEHAATETAEGERVPGADPSAGPGAALWTSLLQVVSNDLHGRSSNATVLTTATQSLLPSLAVQVLSNGADANLADAAGMSPLMYALVLGQEPVVAALVNSKKCRIDAVDAQGNPALIYAFLSLRPDDLQATFAGPCPHDAEEGSIISLLGAAPFAPLLVAAKVDLLVADVRGNSPLLLALGMASKDVLLGGYRISVASSSYSPQTPRTDTTATAALLLQAGASVNFCNRRCITPLHLAAARGHVEMIDLLLRSGAWPNALDLHGYLPLHYLAAACPEGAVESASRLLTGCSDHPLRRLAFDDQRTGKSDEDKILVDIGATFSDIFTAALDPLSIRTARHSALSVFLLPADNGMNVLHLALASAQLQDEIFAPFLVGDKDQRLALGVWLASYPPVDALPQLFRQVDASGFSVLHAAALLLQGLTPVRQLTPAEQRSKRVKYYASLELHLLDKVFSHGDAAALSGLSLRLAPGVPSLPTAGWSALHAAIAADNSDLVKALLARGADVVGAYAFVHFTAATNAGVAVVDAVVSAASQSANFQALLNSVAHSGNPECEIVARPLTIAARRGNASALQALVGCLKVDPNLRDEATGTTAVHDIVERSDLSALDAVAVAADRIDLLVEGPHGTTSVDVAIEGKDLPVLERLLSMRRNDVVERVLFQRGCVESLLCTAERENIRLATECGFVSSVKQEGERATATGPVEEEKAELSSPRQQDEQEEAAVANGRGGLGDEETKEVCEEATDLLNQKEERLMVPLPVADVADAEPRIVSAHDLKLLQESDDLVLVLMRAVNGLVGPDVHAHHCFYEGRLYRDL